MSEFKEQSASDNIDKIKKLVLSSQHLESIPLNLFEIKEDALNDYKISWWYWKYIYVNHNQIKDPQHTHATIQIWRFILNEEWEIIDCDNIHDNDLLVQFLSIIKKSPFFKKFVENKYWQELWNQNIISRANKRYQEIINDSNGEIEKENKVRTKALSLQNNSLSRKTLSIQENEEVLSVSQSEIWEIDKTKTQRYIETIWAWPCVILIWYNKSEQRVVLSHIDASCDPITTLSVIEQNLWLEWENEFHVLWWDSTSIKMLVEINEWLEQKGINPKTFDVLNESKSVIFDKITWEIFNTKYYNRKPDENTGLKSLMLQNRVMQSSFSWKKLLPEWVKK